jgi:hypothetical protein
VSPEPVVGSPPSIVSEPEIRLRLPRFVGASLDNRKVSTPPPALIVVVAPEAVDSTFAVSPPLPSVIEMVSTSE